MWIAYDDKQGMSSSYGDVEAFRVAEESQRVPQVNINQCLLWTNLKQHALNSAVQIFEICDRIEQLVTIRFDAKPIKLFKISECFFICT